VTSRVCVYFYRLEILTPMCRTVYFIKLSYIIKAKAHSAALTRESRRFPQAVACSDICPAPAALAVINGE
jgi:hypothetical protein